MSTTSDEESSYESEESSVEEVDYGDPSDEATDDWGLDGDTGGASSGFLSNFSGTAGSFSGHMTKIIIACLSTGCSIATCVVIALLVICCVVCCIIVALVVAAVIVFILVPREPDGSLDVVDDTANSYTYSNSTVGRLTYAFDRKIENNNYYDLDIDRIVWRAFLIQGNTQIQICTDQEVSVDGSTSFTVSSQGSQELQFSITLEPDDFRTQAGLEIISACQSDGSFTLQAETADETDSEYFSAQYTVESRTDNFVVTCTLNT